MENNIPQSARKNQSSLINWLCRKIHDMISKDNFWYCQFDHDGLKVDFFITPYGKKFIFILYFNKYKVISYDDPTGKIYEGLKDLANQVSKFFSHGVDPYGRDYELELTWHTNRLTLDTYKIDIHGDVTYPENVSVIRDSRLEKYSYLYITFSELNKRLSSSFNLDDLLNMSDENLIKLCEIMKKELLKYHKELFNHIYNKTIRPNIKDWNEEYFTDLKDHVNDTEIFEKLSLHELFEKAYKDE